jgi:uracil phosphoribosyltransferase
MFKPHNEFPNLTVIDHPLVLDKLARARDEQTDSRDFRRLVNEIAALMTFQVCGDLKTAPVDVVTPMERTRVQRVAERITLVPILRAGLGMTDGILSIFPEARVGHIGLYRDEATLEPVSYYMKLPVGVEQGPVILVDPMVATGNSAAHAIAELKKRSCTRVRLVCLVCAPAGIGNLQERHPDVPIFAAALDRQLNDHGYILPGLGDAGDRLFGTL